jgi:mono/diheme cytochrome c family protein
MAMAMASGALAQDPVDPAVMAAGEALFADNCAVCHQANGIGRATTIPSLVDSTMIGDANLVIYAISNYIANMPPFHSFSDADMAAVATYVRNSFGHNEGGVTPEQVAAERANFDPVPDLRTIWDGVYTVEQAEYGASVYRAPCGLCHGSRLNGSPDDMDMVPGPALARASFLRNWNGRSLGALSSLSHLTMPKSNPGFLPAEDYAAIVAHKLAMSEVPPGNTPLPADPIALGEIIITETPSE